MTLTEKNYCNIRYITFNIIYVVIEDDIDIDDDIVDLISIGEKMTTFLCTIFSVISMDKKLTLF